MALRAGRRISGHQTGTHPLAGHLHQTKLCNPRIPDLGPVAANSLTHFIFDALAISRMVHIDKIDNHKPAHIAQTELAGNLSSSLQIGLQHGLILLGTPFAHAAPAVDIDGNQRFCRINNQITTAFEPDFAFGELFNFSLNAKSVKNRSRIAVVFDGSAQLG